MRIRIPATTANLGCGFDSFGMALGYYNYLDFEEASKASVQIVGHGAKHLPVNAQNLILRAAQAVYDSTNSGSAMLSIIAHNNIPLSRGMGSSSAAIVGGLYAANHVLGQPLSKDKLLLLATEIEGHADNVAPALLGGFIVIVHEGNEQRVKRLALPPSLKSVLAVPDFTVSTKRARFILPQKVMLTDAVYNLSHAAFMVLSLAEGDLHGFGEMLKDRLHQVHRLKLIPGGGAVAQAAQAAGALGCAISGSGPTMIAFYEGEKEQGIAIGEAMRSAFALERIQADIMLVSPDNIGTLVV
ncbi:MAG: homoserine kinase [Firmicutes bacterium]|nr:homoserine kinase [Bacillota bacterium]